MKPRLYSTFSLNFDAIAENRLVNQGNRMYDGLPFNQEGMPFAQRIGSARIGPDWLRRGDRFR